MGIAIVYLDFILPSMIDGTNNLSFARVNLNTASLLPGLVNLITYLVAISSECSSYENFKLGRSSSMVTGTHFAVTDI